MNRNILNSGKPSSEYKYVNWGDTVKIIDNKCRHDTPIGGIHTILYLNPDGRPYFKDPNGDRVLYLKSPDFEIKHKRGIGDLYELLW